MDKLILWLMIPAWIGTELMPAACGVGYSTSIEQIGVLGVILIAARVSELHRTGKLPTLRRGGSEAAESDSAYAVEFEDETEEIWDANS